MKPHRFPVSPFAFALYGSLFLLFPGGAPGSEQRTEKEIEDSVVTAPPTRAWKGEKRNGYVFENRSRSFGDPSRSLAMLAETVEVEPETNISLPITFELDSSERLTGNSMEQLRLLANALKKRHPGDTFLIEGHTCPRGGDEHNNRLSIERANFVVDYLVDAGVPLEALQALGLGPAEARKNRVPEEADESVLSPYRKVMLHRIFRKGGE